MASVLVPILSSLGTTLFVLVIVGIVYLVKSAKRGRIRLTTSEENEDNEQLNFSSEEQSRIISTWDEFSRAVLRRAQLWQISNPPESLNTEITLSQYMSIQEKGVSAWQFDPDLEGTDCFVEARTEIYFYDSECCVQTNLPLPKQNEVYYWEAKMFEMPENTIIAIGLATKPYPSFRLPGYDPYSISYISDGFRRCSQPLWGLAYGINYRQGDVVGVGYRPRNAQVFFTCNGQKFEEKKISRHMNLFPTIGSRGQSQIHVNFGQSGFVFIEANVKRWGLAPMTGTLAPPPAYGLENESILLETGQNSSSVQPVSSYQKIMDQDNSKPPDYYKDNNEMLQ